MEEVKDFLQAVTRSLNNRSADSTPQTEDSTSNPPSASTSSKGKKRKPSILPSSFLKKRNINGGTRKSKYEAWDKDIICLPKCSVKNVSEVPIPRGRSRVYLANKHLIGKVHLTSDMDADDTEREIKTVFCKAVKENSTFSFSYLHPIGGGSKCLTLPNTSLSFVWTAKEVAKAAGKGAIYILADEIDLVSEDEEKSEDDDELFVTAETNFREYGTVQEYEEDLPWQTERAYTFSHDPKPTCVQAINSGTCEHNQYSNYVDLITEDLSDVSDIVDETEQDDLQKAIKESLDDLRTVEEPSDIGEALKAHAVNELNDTSQPQRINVRRATLLEDAISAIGKSTFRFNRNLKVRFIGEPAVDDGGPKREFFRLIHMAIAQTCALFKPLPNGCGVTPNHNIQCLVAGKFATCGRIIALGLLHGCEAPHCFSKAVSDFLVYGSVSNPSCEEMIQSLPDFEVQSKIEKLYEAEDESQVNVLLKNEDFSFAYDCGFNSPITFAHKLDLITAVWRHCSIYSIHAELSQLRDGLMSTLNFHHLLNSHPRAIWKLLVATEKVLLTSDILLDLFTPMLSETGSNSRIVEEQIMHNFCTLLEEIENGQHNITLSEILSFVTGASSVPPTGLHPPPRIEFISRNCLPCSSTCSNTLFLPCHLTEYSKFVDKVVLAVAGCCGFGQV